MVGLVGFIALLRAPYLGIKFELKNKKWFISSVDPEGPAKGLQEFAGSKVSAIGGLELSEYDLVDDDDTIPDKDSLDHYYKAQRYFDEHIKTGTPLILSLVRRGQDGSIAAYRLQVKITPSSYPIIKAFSSSAPYYVLAFICLAIGLAVVLKKPEDKRARLFWHDLYRQPGVFSFWKLVFPQYIV